MKGIFGPNKFSRSRSRCRRSGWLDDPLISDLAVAVAVAVAVAEANAFEDTIEDVTSAISNLLGNVKFNCPCIPPVPIFGADDNLSLKLLKIRDFAVDEVEPLRPELEG